MLSSYRDLLVWQKAMEFAVKCYRFSHAFPKSEIYGLASQLRRASVSIASNMAEGYGRGSRKEYVQFLFIAQGSLKEAETQTILAQCLSFGSQEDASELLRDSDVLEKMLRRLIVSLRTKPA